MWALRACCAPLFFGSCAGARIAFVVGRVACTLFGSALAGCASGGCGACVGFVSLTRALFDREIR